MQSISLYSTDEKSSPIDIALEVTQLEALLNERRKELADLQQEFRDFKLLYTQVVGSKLSELAEIERAIKEAEKRLFNDGNMEEEEETGNIDQHRSTSTIKLSVKKLFWSVAKMFHPDHALTEEEAERRHTIMVEANRAYEEGDVESLETLLGNEEIHAYCAVPSDPDDIKSRLILLKEELRTIEFGIKRIKQDGLHHIKLNVEEEARQGRDALADMAEKVRRRIVKARYRLEHLGEPVN
jgi:hypothetical protein